MFNLLGKYILKYTRDNIEAVTGGIYHEWTIGISNATAQVIDKDNDHYSWPCAHHDTALTLVDEYISKGMKAGKCDKKGLSVFITRTKQ